MQVRIFGFSQKWYF